MKTNLKQYYKRFIIICPIIIVILFIMQIVYLSRFNAKEYVTKGADETQKTYMNIANRGDSTSSWLKRDFEINGEVVDLHGETIDGTLYNNSGDIVSDWNLRINIENDCFINNAWCGTVQIHQFVDTENEKVQTLDLRNYKLEDINLEYRYDGDLLIPLKKGDFILYYPSVKDTEVPIESNSEMTMGVIFYFVKDLDLSNYKITYNYHRTIYQGNLFYIIIFLLIVWLSNLVIYIVSVKIYDEAQRELELKKSGISSMSDMYNTIYIVDLVQNEIVSVVAEEESELKRPEQLGADEQFRNLFEMDSTEAFKKIVLEFTDLTTLRGRMQGKNNIACEYISRNYGWCRLRFFTMDYVEGQPIDRVVFTIQVIDNEKREMDNIEEKINRVESEKKEMSAFLEIISKELVAPNMNTLRIDQRIIDEAKDDKIREYAIESKRSTYRHTKLLIDVLEFSNMEAGNIDTFEQDYSFEEILIEAEAELKADIDEDQVEYLREIVQPIPDTLYGDGVHIKQIISILLLSAAETIETEAGETGTIKLSVFSKITEDQIHLLVSVKDNGTRQHLESRNVRMKLVNGILKLMGSELHTLVSEENENEAYFEVDQIVRDS